MWVHVSVSIAFISRELHTPLKALCANCLPTQPNQTLLAILTHHGKVRKSNESILLRTQPNLTAQIELALAVERLLVFTNYKNKFK
jgi:hypothetical protein